MSNDAASKPRLEPAGGNTPPLLVCSAERPWGSIVLLHEGFGLNAFMERQALRFARAGLNVAAPALFWRDGVTSVLYTAETEAARLARNTGHAGLLDDIASARRALAGTSGPTMLAGWCFGAMAVCLATLSGEAAGHGFSAAVAWYPVRLRALVEAQAGHRVRTPLLLFMGEHDRFVSGEEREWMAAWAERQPCVELVELPRADHGFCNADRTDLHDPGAAEASWRRTCEHLHRHATPQCSAAPAVTGEDVGPCH